MWVPGSVYQVVVEAPRRDRYVIHYSHLAQLRIKGGAAGIAVGILAHHKTIQNSPDNYWLRKFYRIININEDLVFRSIEVTIDCKVMAAVALISFQGRPGFSQNG